ncbi:voltage-dependent calcium channel subunit alpha-2/delta-3 isoform X2 [Agrilus planipennis]|uniref:Voltage-dependent calcium channel subunit alpha-2/delta-3 isoform X2 n=1 Tax=Agrilus planipennis TaxID=224129 RepID=A0A1W4WYM4_AGRPL|nr:voltage-dependent calcium channel subunit alpha-2/delta-3 isoform X2 [Agrilus planipennis]
MVRTDTRRKTASSRLHFLLFLLLLQTLPISTEQEEDIPHQEVKNWAIRFGFNLWSYGKQITRMTELQKRYHQEKIDVVRKDGLIRIREFAGEVKNMMDIKMSAVMRIMDSAEQAALTPQADSGQPIKFYDARKINIFGPDGQPVENSRGLILTPNTHFDHLPVNTSLSSVLIPTHIDISNLDVMQAIQWSEHLDPLFVNNYESDPSLSWQFFGSSVGFLRRYPAISWPPGDAYSSWQRLQNAKSVYDFRSSSWYVNAATSPKDIVILLDVSPSMTSSDLSLAKSTTEAILDTLSNNDFVNVLKFSDTVEEIMPCFRNLLVQANNENVQNLKDSLGSLSLESGSNFTSALVAGFEILHKYNRTGQGCQCNQAIMLISSAPPSSYKEIFKIYNWPHRPVRVFTYLVGSSGTSSEMHWMACENKGYYTRINRYDQIKHKVLHYIEVMARPMVMYQNDHPIQWSSAYLGGKRDSLSIDKKEQLMTTVSIPVFDRRNHSVRVANLLGVVGTDVSVDQIKKLVPSFKLGVNGYSFVVNNNGHILYHPDLRPLSYNNENFDETLKPSYLSVDLNEVELIDGENGPRENHSALLDLRQDMIDQKEGETELNVKVHYDEMRRVTTRRQKYFYNPIEGTPFSLGIAIPEGYGMYELIAEQEIKHSQKNVTEYFKGDNWRVHPDWVYCEYTSGYTGEKFKTAEERVLHFLSRTRRPGWKWMSLRPRYHNHHSSKQEKDAYFCDKTLLQSLVLDAMVTEEIERSSADPKYNDPFATLWVLLLSQGHVKMFGLQLSFIATRSGLLRWKDYTNNSATHFSEQNVHATDEIWYKRAVDQHAIEADSFVFSVPHNVGANSQTLVTATHAIFVEHKGHRAPVAVVGMQFLHSELADHFLVNITTKCSGPLACTKTCKSEALDCYILDNNGFIIISENPEHTGRFFGQIDGTIMDSLVQDRIYKKIQVYDYQGACPSSRINFSGHSNKISPFFPMVQLVNWVFKAVTLLMPFLDNLYGAAFSFSDYPEQEYDLDGNYAGEEFLNEPDSATAPSYFPSNPSFAIPPTETDPLEGIDMSQFGVKRCDRKVDLYNLQPARLNTSGMSNPLKGKLTNCHSSGCERPFSVQKIPHSNLILLVVDTLCPCGSKQLSIQPQEILYESKECLHKPKDGLYRRRPPKCINYHPEEIEIKLCGEATEIGVSFAAIIIGLIHCLIASLS